MYSAVKIFALSNGYPLYAMLPVAIFIVSGFHHCVADMFYLSLDNAISINSVLNIVLIIIGNSIGGMFVPLITKIFTKKEE